MEDRARLALRRVAAAEHGIKLAEPAANSPEFSLNGDLDSRLRDWSILKRFGLLADAGGVHDQDAFWLDDMLTLDGLFNEEYDKIADAQRSRTSPS